MVGMIHIHGITTPRWSHHPEQAHEHMIDPPFREHERNGIVDNLDRTIHSFSAR